MMLSILMAGALAIGAQNAEAIKHYTFDTSGTSQEVQAGKGGNLKLAIKPEAGFHVSPDAPLKISLSGEGVELSKKALGHEDAKDKKSEAPEFEVKFGAVEAGQKSIAVEAMFFVCSEKICERKVEKVTVAVNVKK
jgi:hypothetical protein